MSKNIGNTIYDRSINYYETDQMGIVHHSNYIRYFEEARLDMMEQVGLSYDSHARDASLLEVLKQSRERDKIMGFSLRGIHKDELNMLLGDFPIKKEGSQGQNKTYLVALKLAQFDFLKRTGRTIPLLLLDDIFDKLDASRVEQIVKLVAGDSFGQIFITDTNREHLDRILQKVGSDYKIFRVDQGVINEMGAEQ